MERRSWREREIIDLLATSLVNRRLVRPSLKETWGSRLASATWTRRPSQSAMVHHEPSPGQLRTLANPDRVIGSLKIGSKRRSSSPEGIDDHSKANGESERS